MARNAERAGSPYPRPELAGSLGRTVPLAAPRYPYPAAMLRRHDIFELLVLDGGAYFFTRQFLGGTSTSAFIQAFASGRLLRPWRPSARSGPGRLNWFGAYDPERGPWGPGQKIEEHVWLHRLYFLLPLAQQYFRTGQARWAGAWWDHFLEWRRRFPCQGEPAGQKPKHSAWIWHDMQVTWRLLVFLHSVFLLGSPRQGRVFSGWQWGELYRAIELHARWVHAEAVHGLAAGGGGGNHFLQKGTALLLAGTLFPEFEGSAQWLRAGRLVVRDQLEKELKADGGSIEASPSYSHFIAGLYLAAQLALAANRKPRLPGLDAAVLRQYRFLAATLTPSGKTLQVGDSYALDGRKDLRIAGRLLGTRFRPPLKTRCLAPSRIAFLEHRGLTACLELFETSCGHSHPFKPNLLAWRRGAPVLVDTGCVNYDLAEHRTIDQVALAHNVLAPDPALAAHEARVATTLKLRSFQASEVGGCVVAECHQRTGKVPFRWTRRVILRGAELRIEDRVVATRAGTFRLAFHLAPCAARLGGGQLLALGQGWRLTARCRSGQGRELPWTLDRMRIVDEENEAVQAPFFSAQQRGTRLKFLTVMTIAGR